ncbi:MAG: NADH-ubiquinone oxidoreductase family protein [Candidatus Midichloriaceae bacterium]|jgi:hypothetical protein|nr:NADH-ubiquinone oxidoreductase family protein [Candidatus Midichloriaceae bacterium]
MRKLKKGMSRAKIYKPCRSAMQSGKGKTKSWLLEYISSDRYIEPIMGWIGSSDMYAQEIKLYFDSKEEAVSYAERNNIEYDLIENQEQPKPAVRAYSTIYTKP